MQREDGRRPSGRATLADVADELGLSPSTVSRALDPQKSKMVNPETRARVVSAAERLRYRPDLQARSLMTGRTQTIVVVAADLGNTWVTPILHGVADRVSVEGVVPIIAETNDDSSVLADLMNHMLARRVDGMIILAARRGDADVIESAARIVPVVVAARSLSDVSVPVVTHDDRAGGAMVAHHFADLGHRHVSELRGPNDVMNFPLRSNGFLEQAHARGLIVIPTPEEAASPTFEEGVRLMTQLLDHGTDLPTAIFAHNDALAIGAISALKARGRSVPAEVSVAGYNDLPLTGFIDPPLTTVRYPGWEVGHAAAGVAIEMVYEGADGESRCLDPQFVARDSTASPSA